MSLDGLTVRVDCIREGIRRVRAEVLSPRPSRPAIRRALTDLEAMAEDLAEYLTTPEP